MKKSDSQTGSAHIVIVVVLALALVGGLGYVFWNNFLDKKETVVAEAEVKPTPKAFCSDGENAAAEKGVFCSEEMGIKFSVPSIFVDKLTKLDNYPVYEGSLDYREKKEAGFSELAYHAVVTGNDNFSLTIAKEPLRSGDVGLYHMLQGTYFDQATGELTGVNGPTSQYDSATDSYTWSGGFSKGETVPSFDVDGIRFYKTSSGDAGTMEIAYLAVINNKIIKIHLGHSAYMGDPANDPTTIDADKVSAELEQSIKSLKFLKS